MYPTIIIINFKRNFEIRYFGFKVARAVKPLLWVGKTVRKIRKVNRCFLNGLGRIGDEDAKGFANGEESRNNVILVNN